MFPRRRGKQPVEVEADEERMASRLQLDLGKLPVWQQVDIHHVDMIFLCQNAKILRRRLLRGEKNLVLWMYSGVYHLMIGYKSLCKWVTFFIDTRYCFNMLP